MLTPIYGADKFQVSINLDLNFDSIERKKVTYDDPEIKSETVQAAGSQGTVQEAQTGTVDDNVSNVTGTDGEGTIPTVAPLKMNWIPRPPRPLRPLA